MNRKRILFFLLGSVLFIAIVFATIVSVLRYNGTSTVNNSAFIQQTSLNLLHQQVQKFNYPDPAKQEALPESVKVTGDNETVLLSTAVTEGYQIYECQASATDATGFAWKVQAPFALLKAANETNVIHSTDPTWLYVEDGSEIKAVVAEFIKPDGTTIPATATQNANAIPWLRLVVTEHRGNSGLFSKVDYIQRLYTEGGKAIHDGCDQNAANHHVIQPVGYQAEYVFWGRK